MILSKLKYGIEKLYEEIINKEDYWHIKLKARQPKEWYNYYYHSIIGKAKFEGNFNEEIPVLNLNFFNVEFHITTLNYGLGLIEDYHLRNRDKNIYTKIEKICSYLINELNEDGSLRYNLPKETNHFLANNKPSGMTQGLLLSFLIRCKRIGIGKTTIDYNGICEKILTFLLSEEIIALLQNDKGEEISIIEEFYVPGYSILNGAVFGLYGVIDYEKEFLDDKRVFSGKLLNDMISILHRYSFCKIWSFYDLNKTISSGFYHDLHLNMLDNLYSLTNNAKVLRIRNQWDLGFKFRIIFILLKAFQKLKNINKMPISNI